MSIRLYMSVILLFSYQLMGLEYNPQEVLGSDPNDISAVKSGSAGFSQRPKDEVVAAIEWPRSKQWFATATVIGPNIIITAAHWKQILQKDYPRWPIGYKLKRLGLAVLDNEYVIVEEKHDSARDILLCRVKKTNPSDPNSLMDADFKDVSDLYEGNDEVGKKVTIGCFGKVERYSKPWGECTEEERKTQIQKVVSPGTLHWGCNIITGAMMYKNTTPILVFRYDPIGKNGYVQYEACGTEGNSGSPWFIQDSSGRWALAGMFTSGTTGPRISANRDTIRTLIDQME